MVAVVVVGGWGGGDIPLRECFLMTAHRVENVAVGDVKTLINKGSYSTSCTLKAAIMSKQCFTGCDGHGIFLLRARGGVGGAGRKALSVLDRSSLCWRG